MSKITITTPNLTDISLLHKWGHENSELWYSNSPSWHSKTMLKGLIENPGKDIFLVAKDGNKTVGMCLVYNMRDWAYLSSLFVDKNYRGRGVGKLLLQKVRALIKPHKIDGLHLVTKIEGQAFGFYKKLGFKEGNHFVWLRKDLRETL